MKNIVKVEIALLIVVALVAAGMILASEGVFGLFSEPVIEEKVPEPIPEEIPESTEPITEPVTDPPETEPTQPPTTEPPVTEPAQEGEIGEETVPEGPRALTAARYYIYDTRKEAYLQTLGDVHEKLYPASITKLMTVLVLLEYMDPEDTVTVGDALWLVREDSTTAGLMEGDVLTVEQLISAMMLPSGNDAAQVAAVAAGRVIGGEELDCWQAVAAFADKMNEKARELGMENSHFVNPDGMPDENHYTTMHDLVILSKEILKNQIVLKYTSKSYDAVQVGERTLEWRNTNLLLHEAWETYVPATIGLKTGYTAAAGGCLVTAFAETDRIILIGVFGCPAYTLDRYLDTVDLYNSLT